MRAGAVRRQQNGVVIDLSVNYAAVAYLKGAGSVRHRQVIADNKIARFAGHIVAVRAEQEKAALVVRRNVVLIHDAVSGVVNVIGHAVLCGVAAGGEIVLIHHVVAVGRPHAGVGRAGAHVKTVQRVVLDGAVDGGHRRNAVAADIRQDIMADEQITERLPPCAAQAIPELHQIRALAPVGPGVDPFPIHGVDNVVADDHIAEPGGNGVAERFHHDAARGMRIFADAVVGRVLAGGHLAAHVMNIQMQQPDAPVFAAVGSGYPHAAPRRFAVAAGGKREVLHRHPAGVRQVKSRFIAAGGDGGQRRAFAPGIVNDGRVFCAG